MGVGVGVGVGEEMDPKDPLRSLMMETVPAAFFNVRLKLNMLVPLK